MTTQEEVTTLVHDLLNKAAEQTCRFPVSFTATHVNDGDENWVGVEFDNGARFAIVVEGV